MNIDKILNSAEESSKCESHEKGPPEEPTNIKQHVYPESSKKVSPPDLNYTGASKIHIKDDTGVVDPKFGTSTPAANVKFNTITVKSEETHKTRGHNKRNSVMISEYSDVNSPSEFDGRYDKCRKTAAYSEVPVSTPATPPKMSSASLAGSEAESPSSSALHTLDSDQSEPHSTTAAFPVKQESIALCANSGVKTSSFPCQQVSDTQDQSQKDQNQNHKESIENTLTVITSNQGSPSSKRAVKSKRSKAKNTQWTLEEDRKLVDLVLSTLPTQDFGEYARYLNKRDANTVRYRWKVLVRRAKGEGSLMNNT